MDVHPVPRRTATRPADPADPAEPADPTVASDREATSESPSADVAPVRPLVNRASLASRTASSTSAPISAGAEYRSRNRPSPYDIDSSAALAANASVPGTSRSSRPDESAPTPLTASPASVPNWYRDNARRSCGTVVIGASSPTDSSWEAGAYRATTTAWSTDTCPATIADSVVGSSTARRANRTTSRARAGDRPACSTSQCSGDRIPPPAHRSPSSTRPVRSTRSA